MRFLVPKSRASMAGRVLAAAILVIGACAAAVATAGLLQVNTLAGVLSMHAGVSVKQLTLPKPGAPETILLIGSDHRAGEPFRNSNTDTILLVHLNAKSSTINVMSIPRDLKVNVPSRDVPPSGCATSTVPGDCAEKINAAYSQGGYGLLIRTIKQNVFPDLKITHIVDTNFRGFSDLVDAIGCIYADVDHRYYNISSGITGDPDDYSSIDIQPGYQRLCGHNQAIDGALPFVRFRHTDSDLVREARQQDFLRWAKQNFTTRQLFDERTRLLHILAEHSTFDKSLQTTNGLLDLFNLVLDANGGTLKQVPFPADLSQSTVGEDFVLPQSTAAVRRAFARFMRPSRAAAPRTAGGASGRRSSHQAHRAGSSAAASIDTAGLTADPLDGRAQARVLTPNMGVLYPNLIDSHSEYCTAETAACLNDAEPGGAYAHSYPRQYTVREPDGRRAHAYVMTIALTNAGLGQYYGVQGLHWTDPPLLRHPQAARRFRGRTLHLFEDDGGHITDVSFRVGPDVYWISNTLTSALPNHEMLAIAESMTLYRG
jgi:polyisoprenyl-teichoic acid--peptidoglycan teichoic acid transferase